MRFPLWKVKAAEKPNRIKGLRGPGIDAQSRPSPLGGSLWRQFMTTHNSAPIMQNNLLLFGFAQSLHNSLDKCQRNHYSAKVFLWRNDYG